MPHDDSGWSLRVLAGDIRVWVTSLRFCCLLCFLVSALDIDLYIPGAPAALMRMALSLYQLRQVCCAVNLKRRCLRILVFIIVDEFGVLELERLTRGDQAFLLWRGRPHSSADARFDASSVNK